MKHKALTVFVVLLVLTGLTILIVPKISNRVGEQIAHSAIEDFKALKSKATTDEPTEKKGYDDDGLTTTDGNYPQKDNSSVVQSDNESVNLDNDESCDLVTTPDFDKLYTDSVAYNENLKKHQAELLVDELSYKNPSLNLRNYGIDSEVFGYVSAPFIGMELPIYLGGNDDNMALGAAHMTYTSLPIGGESTNCVLSGHSGYIGRIFFDCIPSLNLGDEIIEKINEQYKGVFTDADRVMVDVLKNVLMRDEHLKKNAKTSDPRIFAESIFPKAFGTAAQNSYMQSQDAFSSLFADQATVFFFIWLFFMKQKPYFGLYFSYLTSLCFLKR